MIRTLTSHSRVAESDDWYNVADDPEFYKDVWFPDLAPGESPTAFRLRAVFTNAGLTVKRIEQTPVHPVWVIHLLNHAAPPVVINRQFVRRIRRLLQTAGFQLKRDEMLIHRNRNGLLVTLSSRPPANDTEIQCGTGTLQDFSMSHRKTLGDYVGAVRNWKHIAAWTRQA